MLFVLLLPFFPFSFCLFLLWLFVSIFILFCVCIVSCVCVCVHVEREGTLANIKLGVLEDGEDLGGIVKGEKHDQNI